MRGLQRGCWLALALLLPLLACCAAELAKPDVWPMPASFKTSNDCSPRNAINLRGATLQVFVLKGDRRAGAAYVERAWRLAQPDFGCRGHAAAMGKRPVAVRVTVQRAECVSPACAYKPEDENYALTIDARHGVDILAASVLGANRAFASLASLASPACDIPCLPIDIKDGPRFGYRGVLLDTARNWFSIADIKRKVVDPMWASKMNVLKWHVYDSQSQPLEVRSIPGLWQPYSRAQAYTQRQARELIDYAFARGVRILPEFDLPGHTAIFAKANASWVACLDALPWTGLGWAEGTWCNQPPAGQLKPEFVGVAETFLREMLSLFPDPAVSTGADEVNFNCWAGKLVPKSSPEYPAFWDASVEKLKAFQSRIAALVRGAGRQWGVYDESFADWKLAGTPALPPKTTIFAWRGADSKVAEATAAGYPVVVMPYTNTYLDCGLGTKPGSTWCAPLKNWTIMYDFDPLADFTPGAGGDPRLVLGSEAAMWSEHVVPVILDYVVWPRAAALAERLWSPKDLTPSAAAAAPRLHRLMGQLMRRGLRVSSLGWTGYNMRYDILPQWCNTVKVPQVDDQGEDYCAPAKLYAGVDLSKFSNVVNPPY